MWSNPHTHTHMHGIYGWTTIDLLVQHFHSNTNIIDFAHVPCALCAFCSQCSLRVRGFYVLQKNIIYCDYSIGFLLLFDSMGRKTNMFNKENSKHPNERKRNIFGVEAGNIAFEFWQCWFIVYPLYVSLDLTLFEMLKCKPE